MSATAAAIIGANLLANAAGIAGSEYSNRKAFERMRSHDIEMFRMQQHDRDAQNKYNAPAAQVARLAAAGINPASVFGSGVSLSESAPVDGSSSASAKGTDWNVLARAGVDSYLVPLQMEKLQADIDLQNANKANVEANTANVEENTKWIEKKALADIESKKANSQLSRGRYEMLKTEKEEAAARIEKLRREADTEIEKQFYYESHRMLNEASIRELNSLLPYKQLLMSAQTENQKAQASLALLHSAYQQGLIDSGYIELLCDKVVADTAQSSAIASKTEIQNVRQELKNAIINGTAGGSGLVGFMKNSVLSAGLLVGSFIPGASNSWID